MALLDIRVVFQEFMEPFSVLNINHVLLLALFESENALTVLRLPKNVLLVLARVGIDDTGSHSRRECLSGGEVLNVGAVFFFDIMENLLLKHRIVELSSCSTGV